VEQTLLFDLEFSGIVDSIGVKKLKILKLDTTISLGNRIKKHILRKNAFKM